jgi:HpaII restriction endonuclease
MIFDIKKVFKTFEGNIIYVINDWSNLIGDNGISMNSMKVRSTVLTNNLTTIDSSLNAVLFQLFQIKGANTSVSFLEFSRYLESSNPLNFDCSFANLFYTRKLKKLLSAVALGMTQSKVWTGAQSKVEHMWVFKNGDFLLPHHILKKREFEDYLFTNTKLESPSSTRHEFGTLYEENGQLYFALNLQIRFK